jgi:hypothetical protein
MSSCPYSSSLNLQNNCAIVARGGSFGIEYNREGRNERTVRISTERNASVLDGAWCDELETVEMYANGATYAAPRANRA